MDFRLTDEQRMLRRTIRELVEKEFKPRAREWDRSGQLPWDNIRRLAEIAWSVNEKTENIGARRLYTVMERLLEQISFEAGTRGAMTMVIDPGYVNERLAELAGSEDLARYVL